jgi:hypothetical protein
MMLPTWNRLVNASALPVVAKEFVSLNRTSQEEGLAPAFPIQRGQAPLPDLFFINHHKSQALIRYTNKSSLFRNKIAKPLKEQLLPHI